jgi:fucose 4-O-acetylase-like acetyltransferase
MQGMNNLSDRWADIDFAKSIGIIMVVWAHAYGPFGKYITAFHMPLFFFLSGMTYKNVGSLKNYIGKKVNRLLKPFWI